MISLYIENQYFDLPVDQEVVMTFASNNIGDVKSRQGYYSNTFKCPMTANNRQILQNAHVIQSGSLVPYRRLDARIEQGGSALVIGFAQVLSIGDDIEIRVSGGGAYWYDLLKGMKMEDIDLTDINHYWVINDVGSTAFRVNDWNSGFVWPNIDYGFWTNKAATTWNHEEVRPAVWAKYFFQKIFSQIGFTITGSFFNDPTSSIAADKFEKTIIPFSAEWRRDRRYEQRNHVKGGMSAFQDMSVWGGGESEFYIDFDTKLDGTVYPALLFRRIYTTPSLNAQEVGTWWPLDASEQTIHISISINNTSGVNQGATMIMGYKGSFVAGGSTLETQAFTMLTGINTYTFDFTVTLFKGDVFFRIDCATNSFIVEDDSTFEVTAWTFHKHAANDKELVVSNPGVSVAGLSNGDSYIAISGTLPNISVQDFLLTIANQYGLIFQTDTILETVTVSRFDDIINDFALANDWSEKIDLSETPKFAYLFERYGRLNILRYEDDPGDVHLSESETFVSDYGANSFDVDNENLNSEVIIFESKFSPTNRIESFQGAKKMAVIPLFIEDTANPGTFKINKVKPRIAILEYDNDSNIAYEFAGPAEPLQPSVFFDPLSFAELLDENYVLLQSILQETKVISILIKLRFPDIHLLDFTKPVYVDKYKSFFYMNEIKQFKFNSIESTEVELVRIPLT